MGFHINPFYSAPFTCVPGLLAVVAIALALATPVFAQSDPPSTPANLRAESSDGDVRINWDDPEDSSITAYDFRVRVVPQERWRPDWTTIEDSAGRTGVIIDNIAVGVNHRVPAPCA